MSLAATAFAFALNASVPALPVADLAGDGAPGENPAALAAPALPETTSAPPVSPVQDQPAPAGPVPSIPAALPEDAPPKPEGQTADHSDIVVTARGETPGDPLAGLNAKSFEAIQAVDAAVVGPVANAYKKGTPKPVRQGLRNFLRNLEEPVIAFNYLLQLKPKRFVKSVGRFALNSSLGIGGLFDVAKREPFNLPYTPNGFANTFACYGIGPGPYFFLPLVGPTTLRDLIGVGMDRAALPAAVGRPFNRPYYAVPANVIDSINDRIDIDEQLKHIRAESADPYAATRDLYLKQRKAEIAAICPKKGETVEETLPPRPGKGRD